MKYNKLVRDKIPEIIKENNQKPTFHKASSDKEYWEKLKKQKKEEREGFEGRIILDEVE